MTTAFYISHVFEAKYVTKSKKEITLTHIAG